MPTSGEVLAGDVEHQIETLNQRVDLLSSSVPDLRAVLRDRSMAMSKVATKSRNLSNPAAMNRPAARCRASHVAPLREPPKINQEKLRLAEDTRPSTSAGIGERERLARMPPQLALDFGLPLGARNKGGVTPVNAKRKFQNYAREVWSVAHKYRLPLLEVQRIADAISSIRTARFGRVSEDELRRLMCRTFDVEDVSKQVLEEAMLVLSADREVTLDSFVSWYVQNMFKHVAGLLGAKDQCASDAMVYDMAKKFGVSASAIDRIKKDFDRFDEDGNGTLEREEFQRMLFSIFQAKTGDLSENRLRLFWMEIDSDNDGTIAFAEYVKWHLKYFDPAGPTCNLADSFYDSFNPRFQRRNNLRGDTTAT
jgi:hypothetical protein